jgi:hypothetical protein
MSKERSASIIAGIGLYLLVSGLSFAVFNSFTKSASGTQLTSPVGGNISPEKKKANKVDPNLPKDQVCPLNGMKYTMQEKTDWETRRPLAVMIENHEEARPQSGLSRADIVYEALAEGWVTRFMGVFYCNTPFENIFLAPVRSARTYFIDWVSEYDALYNHVGGANRYTDNAEKTDPRADALGQIDRYGIKDMDLLASGIGYPNCYRNPDRLDHPVATEHTVVCQSQKIYEIGKKRGWTNVDEKGISWDKNFVPWKFQDEAVTTDRGTVMTIKLTFSEGYEKYDVEWDYDSTLNVYKRKNGGVPHLDLETKEQLTAKNVVVQLTKVMGPVDDNGHMLYTTIGSGKALIFQNGKVIVGSWSKKSRIGRTQFFDATGKEIDFVRGPIWIELLGTEKQVAY